MPDKQQKKQGSGATFTSQLTVMLTTFLCLAIGPVGGRITDVLREG